MYKRIASIGDINYKDYQYYILVDIETIPI